MTDVVAGVLDSSVALLASARVLVVDDEATVRMLIAEVLSENYYNIIEAGDGPSALKVLESERRIDLPGDQRIDAGDIIRADRGHEHRL